MITELEIKNFKSIKELNIQSGRLNVFVGTNSSGKST
ncbi:AAA family ATPase, partial [bacterium]|nr:AAA family ATPase [bacterium]